MAAWAGDGFERWYRAEHGRLVASLTVACGDVDLAHDVVSDAFAKAYERWERVRIMDSPTGWVRQVAVNGMRRRLRRAALERRLLGARPPGTPAGSPSPALEPELWAAVRALPDRQRAVVGLRVVLDLPQSEVARLLGVRPGTVSATLVAARARLARALAATAEDHHG